MIERFARAKINLALHVTGQREDGYHLLDSLVVFAEFGDVIEIIEPHHPHGPIEVSVAGEFAEGLGTGVENLATIAAVLLREEVKRNGIDPKPVAVTLKKNLPIASGIGGGSADAAATLLGLKEYWASDVDLMPIAQSLGADVPMCLYSRPLRARGIGDEIMLLQNAPALNLVLVNAGVEVSTPQVFQELANRKNSPITDLVWNDFPTMKEVCEMRNDLQPSAIGLVPKINTVLAAIEAHKPLLARMSGSGATCFGCFETFEEAQSVNRIISEAHPDWWCVATRTTVS